MKPIKSVTVAEMREIDRHAIEDIGIPSIILMENAGRIAAETILKYYPKTKNIGIFCGGGNNGGDGFVVARYLYNKAINAEVITIKKFEEYTGDALINLKVIRNLGLGIREYAEFKTAELKKVDLIVDALLGTGTKGEIKGAYGEAISAINDSGKPVVAIDIPSGLDADTGLPLGTCIKARLTVAIGYPKKGFLLNNSRKFTGKVIVADIGFPE